MSYHVYTTRGIILSESPFREADKTLRILTRDLGLVRATATGVRKDVSKLAPGLMQYSASLISLIRGKEYWRITNVSVEENLAALFRKDKAMLSSVAKVLSLVERLIQGEEKHPELFDDLETLLSAAVRVPSHLAEAWEIVAVSHMLEKLGYLSKESVPESVFSENALREDSLSAALGKKRSIIEEINKSLRASELS